MSYLGNEARNFARPANDGEKQRKHNPSDASEAKAESEAEREHTLRDGPGSVSELPRAAVPDLHESRGLLGVSRQSHVLGYEDLTRGSDRICPCFVVVVGVRGPPQTGWSRRMKGVFIEEEERILPLSLP